MVSHQTKLGKSALASAITAALSLSAVEAVVAQDTLMLEEVVVTATKRESSVQDI